jgi:hypothetical protein
VARQHRVRAGSELVERRDVPTECVGETHDHVEQGGDVHRVDQRFVADTVLADSLRVSPRQLVWTQRQLFDEVECGA